MISADVARRLGIERGVSEFTEKLRYQARDPEQISDREILARTLREDITDATEAQWLGAYLSQAEELTKKQEELDAQRQIINETHTLIEQARKAARNCAGRYRSLRAFGLRDREKGRQRAHQQHHQYVQATVS